MHTDTQGVVSGCGGVRFLQHRPDREVGTGAGARIYQRKFDHYAGQRNAALREVDYPGDWVLMVDAEERWCKAIGQRIMEIIEDPLFADASIFHFRRKDIFFGTWLKHNIGAGTWTGVRCEEPT